MVNGDVLVYWEQPLWRWRAEVYGISGYHLWYSDSSSSNIVFWCCVRHEVGSQPACFSEKAKASREDTDGR